MMKRLSTCLLILALVTGAATADKKDKDKKKDKKDKEKVVLKPDLRPAEIICPEGVVFGPNNQVKVVVENLSKDSEFEGPVKVELVVIQNESTNRTSYYAEVEAMKFKKKREAVFSVEAKNNDFVRLLAIVDHDKSIPEENEDNNRRLYKVSVKEVNTEPSPSPSPKE